MQNYIKMILMSNIADTQDVISEDCVRLRTSDYFDLKRTVIL